MDWRKVVRKLQFIQMLLTGSHQSQATSGERGSQPGSWLWSEWEFPCLRLALTPPTWPERLWLWWLRGIINNWSTDQMACAGVCPWFYNHYDTVTFLMVQTFLWPIWTDNLKLQDCLYTSFEIFWEIELKCLLYVNSLQEKNLNIWHKRRHILKVTDYQV